MSDTTDEKKVIPLAQGFAAKFERVMYPLAEITEAELVKINNESEGIRGRASTLVLNNNLRLVAEIRRQRDVIAELEVERNHLACELISAVESNQPQWLTVAEFEAGEPESGGVAIRWHSDIREETLRAYYHQGQFAFIEGGFIPSGGLLAAKYIAGVCLALLPEWPGKVE